MKRISLAITLLLFTVSCKKVSESLHQTMNFGQFTIRVPGNWERVRKQGVDSFVGGIKMNDGQVVDFDFGSHPDILEVDPKTHKIDSLVIDGRNAKVVQPRKSGQGTTGIYFNKLDATVMKFQISGVDLTQENQREFLTAIESLKFRVE